ncbi:hypothetical protein QJS04_geneDACA003202 [Acorus gramineus]|uniref:Uncharacterized protein n=1 Tax=Acorus gramineus TaxID=55184 RepID=A0AAV9BUQ9_ACOGR|nr:hypothetical protein QJS04_geneDACA003202 [Acorus gramineus]
MTVLRDSSARLFSSLNGFDLGDSKAEEKRLTCFEEAEEEEESFNDLRVVET